jgi:hypothetical protein
MCPYKLTPTGIGNNAESSWNRQSILFIAQDLFLGYINIFTFAQNTNTEPPDTPEGVAQSDLK